MRTEYLFTSESVAEGHPDKVADQISDAIVDLFLSKDPEARIACETLTTTQLVVSKTTSTASRPKSHRAWTRATTRMKARATRASCSVTRPTKPPI